MTIPQYFAVTSNTVLKKHSTNCYSKAGQTIKQMLVRPKDPLDPSEQCGVVYESDCDVCGEVYVGETGRYLGERIAEHQKSMEKQDQKSALIRDWPQGKCHQNPGW